MSLVTSKCLILISKGYIIQNDIFEVKNMRSKDNEITNREKTKY